MSLIDIDALLAPVSDDEPAGENQEYGVVAELERLSAGNPGKLDPETREMVGAEEPEWRKVRAAALEAFGQTKDLRVGVILTRSLLALSGLPGLGAGIELIARMSETYWEAVHPRLDPDEGDDPIERLNALGNLADPEGMLRMLRATRILESREVGIYTARDLELMTGRQPLPEGVDMPDRGLMEAAWRTGDPEANAARREGVEVGLRSVDALMALFRERTSDVPNLDALRLALKRLKDYYDELADDGSAEGLDEGGEEGAGGGGTASGGGGGGKAGGALASRDDAVRILQQVAIFLRKTEPSSPAPMFIDRAVKMLQADFYTIVRELMPDSKSHIELLGGVSLDTEESS
ncbi:type VI secretion system protein TssA [Piscinibacter sakaiensis]|uniref:Uncharacterized protein ImpA n=1 Tax=Piscinibacter sakaiensis TaxID=1547922 RepID=A0A0K8NWX8_PISS1|nr:type VI secretion system protein TssA [Piscinibacter sakaiensis]GAP34878.1 uncharacterized protein ImpA [Piscinibacter sakaiensis]